MITFTAAIFANDDEVPDDKSRDNITAIRAKIRSNNQSISKDSLSGEEVDKLKILNGLLLQKIIELQKEKKSELSKRWQSGVKGPSELIITTGPKSSRKVHEKVIGQSKNLAFL